MLCSVYLNFQQNITVDPATGAYTTYGTYGLQLTDIAVNNANTVFGVTYDQLYTLNPGTNTATNPFTINVSSG